MTRVQRIEVLLATICLPLVAWAAPSAQQDFLDAMRAVPDLQNGARLFATCASCHGADGAGNAGENIPRIAGQYRQVVTRQLVDYRHGNRPDPRMQDVAARHALRNSRETADVAAYVSALRVRSPAAAGPGSYLQLGREVYSVRCSTCHAPDGRGDESAGVPRLAGQHYPYMLRQFHDALEGRRPQLADSHGRFLQDLDRTALQGVADMLSRAGGRVDPAALEP